MKIKLTLLLSTFLLFFACTLNDSKQENSLKIHMLDVDQGLSVLLETNGQFALFDTGPDSMDIINKLLTRNAKNLEWIAVSHLHKDHAGGLLELINTKSNIYVKNLYLSGTESNAISDSAFRLIFSRNVEPIRLFRGDSLTLGSLTFHVLWPLLNENTKENANSMVLSLKKGNESLLLVGDLESTEESRILSMNSSIKGSVLQVGHHGSKTSSSIKFLEAVAPSYALISVGKENFYGHPHSETLKKLYYVTGDSTRVLRTDSHGDICLEWLIDVGIWPCK